MTPKRLKHWLSGLSLVASLACPAIAFDDVRLGSTWITNADGVLEQVNLQDQVAPEQAVPRSTESKGSGEAVNGAATNGSEASSSEPTVGYLQQQLRCTSIGAAMESCDIKIYGWLSQGFTWNPDSPDNRFNFPMTFNDRSNEYQMNQIYLVLEKPVNTEGCCWDLGGRIDLLYGTDYYFTTAAGLETHSDGSQKWNSSNGPRFQFGPAVLYGLAMPQLYAEIFAPVGNGLSIKVGHFYTPMGYETVTATSNFFYSHTYTHQYFEPFTHTGVLANYTCSKQLKLFAGVVRGWDNWEDNNENATVMAGFNWTSCDERTTLFYGVTQGDEPGLVQDGDRFYQSVYLTHKFTDRLTSVTGSDYFVQQDGSATPRGGDAQGFRVQNAEVYSVYQYLFYEINKCLKAGVRFEWSRDDDNTRVIPVGGLADGANYFSLTTGVNWRLCENLLLQPELRWDWSNFRAGPARAYDDFSDANQFTAAVGVLLTF